MSFSQWVRKTSEHYLKIEASAKIARKLGTTPPLPPRGMEIFWRRIYVPIFRLLPAWLRNGVIATMPGSHRKQWKKQPPSQGPAV
jgi:hypothetical protein